MTTDWPSVHAELQTQEASVTGTTPPATSRPSADSAGISCCADRPASGNPSVTGVAGHDVSLGDVRQRGGRDGEPGDDGEVGWPAPEAAAAVEGDAEDRRSTEG